MVHLFSKTGPSAPGAVNVIALVVSTLAVAAVVLTVALFWTTALVPLAVLWPVVIACGCVAIIGLTALGIAHRRVAPARSSLSYAEEMPKNQLDALWQEIRMIGIAMEKYSDLQITTPRPDQIKKFLSSDLLYEAMYGQHLDSNNHDMVMQHIFNMLRLLPDIEFLDATITCVSNSCKVPKALEGLSLLGAFLSFLWPERSKLYAQVLQWIDDREKLLPKDGQIIFYDRDFKKSTKGFTQLALGIGSDIGSDPKLAAKFFALLRNRVGTEESFVEQISIWPMLKNIYDKLSDKTKLTEHADEFASDKFHLPSTKVIQEILFATDSTSLFALAAASGDVESRQLILQVLKLLPREWFLSTYKDPNFPNFSMRSTFEMLFQYSEDENFLAQLLLLLKERVPNYSDRYHTYFRNETTGKKTVFSELIEMHEDAFSTREDEDEMREDEEKLTLGAAKIAVMCAGE
ncbi:MAG: hypothetical protein LBT98_01690 [Puniceicoccales bacterium]|jgi:hypothetical protein|nr:hypothetical protein [Puniceicoccales bacterium]